MFKVTRNSFLNEKKLKNFGHFFTVVYCLPSISCLQAVDPARLKAALQKTQVDTYDMESWQVIVKDAQSRKIDVTRDTFERIVTLFPTSGRFWKVYIEQEV